MYNSFIQEKFTFNHFRRDFFPLLLFCWAFDTYKVLHFHNHPNTDLFNLIYTGCLQFGTISALICYPAILVGRYKKSLIYFVALAWIIVLLPLLLSVITSGNLTYKVGFQEVFDSGNLTAFGLHYVLLTPQLVVALFATVLFFIRSISK